MRVVVLGAGFGGLELSTRLSVFSAQCGDVLEIVLIDNTEHFVFGYSKLDVMFGKTLPARVQHAYADIVKPGVQFVSTTVTSIDAAGKSVVTDAGTFDADILVIALGADLDPAATPGLVEGGHEFYTEAGAFALREVLANFDGGRVIVAVTSAPFKCPPAPSETALLMHDLLVARGSRERSEISLVMPLPVPIPPSPAASKALLATFVERRIGWYPQAVVRALDCDRQVLVLGDGTELAYDLCLGVPKHRVPAVVQESGLTVDGWIPVDPYTLETSFPDVYAVGDVTSIGTPKAGVFAEGQAAVVASAIADRIRGERGRSPSRYDGHGLCYLEFGSGNVGAVDVTFTPDSPPVGHLLGPDVSYVADKIEFGNTRVRRWFDHEWDR